MTKLIDKQPTLEPECSTPYYRVVSDLYKLIKDDLKNCAFQHTFKHSSICSHFPHRHLILQLAAFLLVPFITSTLCLTRYLLRNWMVSLLFCHHPNPSSFLSQILSAKVQAFLHPSLLYQTEQKRGCGGGLCILPIRLPHKPFKYQDRTWVHQHQDQTLQFPIWSMWVLMFIPENNPGMALS